LESAKGWRILPYTFFVGIHPRTPADLQLAPVAALIDLNLQPLRAMQTHEIADEIVIALNVAEDVGTREDRAGWVREMATRFVDMHGWHAEVTADAMRLHLAGGSVTLDLGLSDSLHEYIEHGTRRNLGA
jgi:hypothetical protein